MKAAIWKDRGEGVWRYSVPGDEQTITGQLLAAADWCLTWEEALAEVLARIRGHPAAGM